jgi:hypothetical protein
MDDLVKAALLKWPHVPACTGWLGLDARGDWYLRDEQAQAAGPFPQVKGSRIEHEQLRAFINRNYEVDAHGAWYFQNGPQRVFVALEAAPWILGVQWLDGQPLVHSHTGQAWPVIDAVWLDELGRLFLASPQGLGLVRSVDIGAAAEAVHAGLWQPEPSLWQELLTRYGVQCQPTL